MPEKPTTENLLQRLTRENQERRAEMYRGQRRYWQFFNIVGRFVGIWFLVLGGILFLWTLTQKEWLAMCLTGFFGPVVGILLLCAKPYRPDLTEDDKKDM